MAQTLRLHLTIFDDDKVVNKQTSNGIEIELPDYVEVSVGEQLILLFRLQRALAQIGTEDVFKHLMYQYPGTNAVVETANGLGKLAERQPVFRICRFENLVFDTASQSEALNVQPPVDAPAHDAP